MSISSKKRVLVVGELNIDLILNDLQHFPEVGKEVLADKMTYTLGSSSAIFASNLSTLGSKVSFAGKVGDDSFGTFIIDYLQQKQISTSSIHVDEKLQTGITVVLNVGEDRAMVTFAGAMEQLKTDEITNKHLGEADHLHVSSVFLQPRLKTGLVDLFQRAKKEGLSTSLDPQWDPAEQWDLNLEKLLPHVDLFLPNQQELAHLTGTETCKAGIACLEDYGHWIVAKQGSKGATVFDGTHYYQADAYLNTSVVDAIGAGDSFDAGFVHQFILGASAEECLDFANLVGAISTTGAGGTEAIQSYDHVIETGKERFSYKG